MQTLRNYKRLQKGYNLLLFVTDFGEVTGWVLGVSGGPVLYHFLGAFWVRQNLVLYYFLGAPEPGSMLLLGRFFLRFRAAICSTSSLGE